MTTPTIAAPTRDKLLTALRTFICQRPGFDPHNYSDRQSYAADVREAGAQRDDALALLAAIETRPSITAGDILAALSNASRLSWNAELGELEYCTGQYFPTEYRRAAASALASILWSYWRDDMPEDCDDKAARIRHAASIAFRSHRLRAYFR